MSVLWFIPGCFIIGLMVLTVASMRRSGAFRRYPVLFIYCLLGILTSVAEFAMVLGPTGFSLVQSDQYKTYYWVNDIITHSIVFLMMMSLIYKAMDGVQGRATICLGLSCAMVLVAGVSLFTSEIQNATTARWMTVLSRNISFCTALLNLVLWSALIRQKKRDSQLLVVSAGLGLATTGKAIGHSLRRISSSAVLAGNLVIMATTILSLLLWWWSFSRERSRPPIGKPWREPSSDDPARANYSVS